MSSSSLCDLAGELACGREHERCRCSGGGGGALHEGDAEGEGLAGPGRRLDKDIPACHHISHRQPLNGEGFGDAAAGQGMDDIGRYAQIGERLH